MINKIIKRQILSPILVFCLVLSMSPIVSASDESIRVSDADALSATITSAAADTTIDLTSDVTVDTFTFTSSYKITITSSNNSHLILLGTNIVKCHLILRDLDIVSAGGFLRITTGIMDIDNCVFSVQEGSTPSYMLHLNNNAAVLNLYSGALAAAAKTIDITKGTMNINPLGDIEVLGTISRNGMRGKIVITEQEDYPIAQAVLGGVSYKSEIAEAGTAGYTLANGATTTYDGLAIRLKGSSAIEPTDGGSIPAADDIKYDVIWGYGGKVEAAEAAGQYTITPVDGYVIDAIYVDGALYDPGETPYPTQPGTTYTYAGAAPMRSLVVQFAYTINFLDPANGTLSVSRDGKSLTSGSIVRGGDVLTITATGASDAYALDTLTLTGLTKNEDGTYTVTAQNGEPTPAVAATMKAAKIVDVSVTSYLQQYVGGNTSAPAGCYTYSLWVNGVKKADNVANEVEPYGGLVVCAAAPGDTVVVQPKAAAGYGALSVSRLGNPLAPDGEGRYTFTVREDGKEDSYAVTVATTKRVEVASDIPNGTVTTDWKEGYTGYIINADGSSDYQSITVTATPNEGYRTKSVSYSTDGGETWKVGGHKSGDDWGVAPPADAVVKAEFVKGSLATTISTEEELRALAAAVNAGDKYIGVAVTLAQNIALTGEWTPIGLNRSYPFMGTFDGQNHTISNLSIDWEQAEQYAGLFGYVSGGTIQNLTVDGNIDASSVDAEWGNNNLVPYYVGSVAGHISAGTISGCTNLADITASSATVGGIAGVLSGSIEGCVNYGSLSGTKRCMDMGGVVGALSGSMDRCVNYGNISFVSDKWNNTDQSGNVLDTYDNPTGNAGGLAACTSGLTTITRSCNKGALRVHTQTAGGLVGCALSSLTLENCYNAGAVVPNANYYPKHVGLVVGGGGLLGWLGDSGTQLTATNCYNAGLVTTEGGPMAVAELYKTLTYLTNCYDSTGSFTNATLGAAYKADTNSVNGGKPLLSWESDTVSDTTYPVTFTVTPANAEITVYSDAAMTQVVEKGASGYALKWGAYYYKVTAPGYMTETGGFNVTIAPVAVSVTLRQVVSVTFNVTPADAAFKLTDANSNTVPPTSSAGGKYVYSLYTGATYTYNASAQGYNSTTREYSVAGSATVSVALSASAQGGAGSTAIEMGKAATISKGGTYDLPAGDYKSAILTISTSEKVALVGSGVGKDSVCEDLHIDYTTAGADLTLQDVYISNTDQVTNLIDFMGTGNTLNFEGVSILDQDTGASGYAMVHVNSSTSLTITGGTAYFYKREQGAGIGGNGGAKGSEGQAPEYNGAISIEGAELFMKGSKQGALIGSGASARSTTYTPGEINIEDSTLNLMTISRAACIGGSAGNTGAAKGTTVTVSNSSVNINMDFSGSAIGGGGFDSGNDADGGKLYVDGSSIRTYVDVNAVELWRSHGVTSAGVNNNVAITADKFTGDGKPAYLLTLDTSRLSGSSFTVKEGNTALYSGGLHQYSYVNESLPKSSQASITYTIDNWTSLSDPNLYLYVTGEDHAITVNGTKFKAAWNTSTKRFTVTNETGETIGGDAGTVDAPSVTVDSTTKVTGGSATTTVTEKAVTDSIKAAAAEKVGTVLIQTNTDGKTATSTMVNLPKASVKELSAAKLDLTVVTADNTRVILTPETLSSIASQATGSSLAITVTAKTAKQAAEVIGATDQLNVADVELGKSLTVEVTVKSGDKAITNFSGSMTIDLPADSNYTSGTSYKVYQISADGSVNLLTGKCVSVGGKLYIRVTVSHLSTFIATRAKTMPFTDVDGHWALEAITYAYMNGLFSGTSNSTFNPDAAMSRAMLVSVLYRMEGAPAVTQANTFGDVTVGTWYADAVSWANANGIVGGYGDRKFGPNDSVTREQMAAILYRYAKFKGYDVTKTTDLTAYADARAISDWALKALSWANAEGLITGRTATTLVPNAMASRAEVAAILMRFSKNIVK